MKTRRTSYISVMAVVSALALAPWQGAAWPQEPDLEPIPVEGRLSPDGRFKGTLMVTAVTVADAGQLLLSGVLDGTATRRGGAYTRMRGQPFTASAVPVLAEATTDVVLLQVAPITLTVTGRPLTLAPVPVDIEAVPDEGLGHGHDGQPLG
jgi:hypothetical protein